MMEDAVFTDDSLGFDDDEVPNGRLAPLGAVASPAEISPEIDHASMEDQLKRLEDEQDQLNSSLLALTSHFAQVQFRLKQIINAQPSDKEDLLKDLEEFAFQGCPDVRGCVTQDAQFLEDASEKEHQYKISEQREKQMELISQLKNQLDDIEKFAYEGGSGEVPHSLVMEKQNAIIDELRAKLDLDLEGFDKMTADDLKRRVDLAIGKIVNPAKVKGQVINQLQHQISDLERFISFLQGEVMSPGPLGGEACSCRVHGPLGSGEGKVASKTTERMSAEERKKQKEANISAMKKALSLLQYIAITQLGCGTNRMKESRTKQSRENMEYQDLLQKLDRVVIDLIRKEKRRQLELMGVDEDYTSDSSDSPISRPLDEVTITVRRELCPLLRMLYEHGMIKMSNSKALMTPITACLAPTAQTSGAKLHIWELFKKYFEIKHGKEFSTSPARCLSQSFGLDIIGGTAITSRQILLATVHAIEESHEPLKRSPDSRFKAFVCEALNQKKLSVWCKHIVKTKYITDNYYYSWSYLVTTGFEGALQILDKLNEIKFHLPADLAVKQFHGIKDAF